MDCLKRYWLALIFSIAMLSIGTHSEAQYYRYGAYQSNDAVGFTDFGFGSTTTYGHGYSPYGGYNYAPANGYGRDYGYYGQYYSNRW